MRACVHKETRLIRQSFGSSYPQESLGKATSRIVVFDKIQRAFKHHARPPGLAVTLCGPQALDIPHLLELGYKSKDIVAIDRSDISGLHRATKLAPGCLVWPDDAAFFFQTAARYKKSISLAILDFMGGISPPVQKTMSALAPLLVKGSIVSYTFDRHRKPSQGSQVYSLEDFLRRFHPPFKGESQPTCHHLARAIVYRQTLLSLLGENNASCSKFEELLYRPYMSSHSPMVYYVIRKVRGPHA